MSDKTIDLLEKYLDGGYVVSPLAPNITLLEDILDIENELEVKFPKEYIDHLLAVDAKVLTERGLYIAVKEDLWPRPKLYDVAPFWQMCYGIHTYTASSDSEDWMRLLVAGRQFVEENELKAVPILKVIGDSNLYCTDENANIVQYDYSENTLTPINLNFWQLLEQELKSLKERKDEMDILRASKIEE